MNACKKPFPLNFIGKGFCCDIIIASAIECYCNQVEFHFRHYPARLNGQIDGVPC